jgi:hypothetical protein
MLHPLEPRTHDWCTIAQNFQYYIAPRIPFTQYTL